MTTEGLTILPLVPTSDPRMKTPPTMWDFKNKTKEDATALGQLLFANMIHYKGLGISANQLGIDARVFCVSPMIYGKEWSGIHKNLVFFNPVIDEYSPDKVYMEEGCLTWPGLFIKIKRSSSVKITYMTESGEVTSNTVGGLLARVFLHEMDHMEGMDFLGHASSVHRQIAFQKRNKHLRQLKKVDKRQAEIRAALPTTDTSDVEGNV